MSSNAPIGIFDSGLGGLTVLKEIRAQLPGENLIYLGDTARVPYGPKSPETVTRFALEAALFLLRQGVKVLVVACNTSSAMALEILRATLRVPVIGVIEPGIRAAVATAKTGRIGVIGTLGTVSSEVYQKGIQEMLPGAEIHAVACPLFVPLVEEGWVDHPVTKMVAQEYLGPLRAAEVDTLVLGCTHYPVLKGVIGEAMGPGTRLVDSAEEVAAEAGRVLSEADLLSQDSTKPDIRFYATDVPERMGSEGERIWGTRISRVTRVEVDELAAPKTQL
jgi:glutamate racemase